MLHDLWNVEVQVHETGVFKHVNPITRSKVDGIFYVSAQVALLLFFDVYSK